MRSELAQLGTGAQALVIQILGNADDAQDGVHDAFETALGRPGAYDVRKGPLKPCVPARGSQPLHRHAQASPGTVIYACGRTRMVIEDELQNPAGARSPAIYAYNVYYVK